MSWEKVQISHKNNPPELQSFHFTWHVALPDPSDTLGMLWHLGGPGGCVIQCDSWRQEDRQGLGLGIRKGELCLWNSELSTSLSSSPKCYPYCPGKGDITTKEAALRDQLDPPKQAASCLLNFSATDKTASVSALHFRPLNSLQPRTSPGRLCGQLVFPLCGAFASSAVGLFISLHSLSSLPDTCILQAALECWVSRNNGRLWTGLRPGPSQYLLQCEATVLKLLPSRTQQWGVPRGFEILFQQEAREG